MNEKHYRIIKSSLWAVLCIATVLPALLVVMGAAACAMHWLAWKADNTLRRMCGMPTTEFLR